MTALLRRLREDNRGTLFLEAFVASVPVFMLFVALCQLADLYVHRWIVQRAAAAAVRAAVVVLPDDGLRYGDPRDFERDRFVGARKREVEAAAWLVLDASPSFDHARTELQLSGDFEPDGHITAHLATRYQCLFRLMPLVCGTAGALQLEASARLRYQGARYQYPRPYVEGA